MKAIWADYENKMNTTVAFVLDLKKKTRATLNLAAASLYKVYLDGELFLFGPQRAAKGYARETKKEIEARYIAVEVESIYVETFWVIKQEPFFACEITCEDGKEYSSSDFVCYRLNDRVTKVQKYSYQRGFAESYKMSQDRRSLYMGEGNFPRLATKEVELPKLQPSLVDTPTYQTVTSDVFLEKGSACINGEIPVWRDRAHTMAGAELGGYKIEEWEDSVSDIPSQLVFKKDAPCGDFSYNLIDYGKIITGFTTLKIKASKPGTVYVLGGEILSSDERGENYVKFERDATSNVFKWEIKEAGEYLVSTFEPYAYRYACIVFTEGLEAKHSVVLLENPNVDKFIFKCQDKRAEKIMEAARTTLAQNAVDLLTDCPSRERAGWLSDSYFSSVAERLFTGENQAEEAFLDNYKNADTTGLPKGIIPMCYPANVIEGTYIPNWTLWYIMEIAKYARIYGKNDTVLGALKNVRGILDFFAGCENELGLLEDLKSWVFVEWSIANHWKRTMGVNVPSNMTYAKCLEEASWLLDDEKLKNKATRVRNTIKKIAFNGKFFVDNLIRNEDGSLQKTDHLTEVCQYYAFWFDCITKEEYPALYRELMDNLGTNRRDGYLPEVGVPNAMYGLYMRIDLLMREGKREDVYRECIALFEKMAEKTGTLWEHNSTGASCVHGFAAYASRWLVYALTGYDVISGEQTGNFGIGIDCEISIPQKGKAPIILKIQNNKLL